MSKNTTATAATTRMFDGAKWDTYKTGGKKHLAAQARRAEFDASRPSKEELAAKKADRALGNAKTAAWMRSKGIQPQGRAWTECSKGERDVAVLIALNVADDCKPVTEAARKTAKAQFKALNAGATIEEARTIRVMTEPKPAAEKPAKAPKAKASKPAKVEAAPVVTEEPAKKGKKAERKAAAAATAKRAEAARKGWETRRANAAKAAEVEVEVEVVEAKAPKAKKAKKAKAAKVATVEAPAQIAAEVSLVESAIRSSMTAMGIFTAEQIDRAVAIQIG